MRGRMLTATLVLALGARIAAADVVEATVEGEPDSAQPATLDVREPVRDPGSLTVDEQWLLKRGYISDGEVGIGAATSFFIGFGFGQVVERRLNATAYAFIAADAAGWAFSMEGVTDLFGECWERACSASRLRRDKIMWVGGTLTLLTSRIVQLVDAIAGPHRHNERLRDLRIRLGESAPLYTRLTPYIAPRRSGADATVAGISLQF